MGKGVNSDLLQSASTIPGESRLLPQELKARVSAGVWVLCPLSHFYPSKSGQVNPGAAADAQLSHSDNTARERLCANADSCEMRWHEPSSPGNSAGRGQVVKK